MTLIMLFATSIYCIPSERIKAMLDRHSKYLKEDAVFSDGVLSLVLRHGREILDEVINVIARGAD